MTQNCAQLRVTNIIHKQMKESIILMITSYLGFSCFTPELFSAAHGSFQLVKLVYAFLLCFSFIFLMGSVI